MVAAVVLTSCGMFLEVSGCLRCMEKSLIKYSQIQHVDWIKYHETPIGSIALSRPQKSSVLNKGEDKGITPTIEGKFAIVHCSALESTSLVPSL